jgi:hypothetical protein
MKRLCLFLFNVLFASSIAFTQPLNDDCSNSTILIRQSGNICNSSVAATTVSATRSSQSSTSGVLNFDDDVWFSFTLGAGQTSAVIRFSGTAITGTNNGLIMELWGSDCSTYASYSKFTGPNPTNFDWNLAGLTAGASYKIRVATDNIVSRATFNICFLAGPANDDCSNATILTPVEGVNTCTFTPGILDGSTSQATPSSQTSGDATGKDDDVWFQFTTQSTSKNYKVDISNDTYTNGVGTPVIELWQQCGDATFVSWYPNTATANLGILPANTTYKLRIYTYGTTTRFAGLNICVSYQTPPPPNDGSFTASTISLSNNNTCTNIVTGGTTLGATPDFVPTCSGAPSISTAKDVWYKFIATTLTATFEIRNKTLVAGTSNLMWMQVFESSNTNPKLCVANNTADVLVFDGSSAATTLTPGTTYYLRVYNDDPASACTFDICNYLPKGPSYDECSMAVNLQVSTNEYCNNSVKLTNDNATTSTIAVPACASNVFNDVWVKFTAPSFLPATGLRFSIQNFQLSSGSNPNLQYAVYSGNCAGLTYLSCDALPTLTAGVTYYIRIFSAYGSGTGSFDVCLSPNPTALINTTCNLATTLVATTDQLATFTYGTTYGLPTVNTILDCFGTPGSPNKSVWYKFVATATTHYVEFKDMLQLDLNANALGFRVTTGACPTTDLPTPVCVSNILYQNQTLTGLTIGQTYFIEVMENTFNGGAVSYKLRVISTGSPANDEATGSTLLIQNPTCSETDGSFRFSTLSATPPTSLGATYDKDVWYKFQAAATSATVTVSGRLVTPRLAFYNASGTTLFDAGAEDYSYTLTGLTIGNFYTIRVLNTAGGSGIGSQNDFKICVSGVPSTSVIVTATPISCLTNDNIVISTNSNRWLHFTRGGNLIASVFDGATMGNMTAKYFINSGAVRVSDGIEYMDRNLEITPATQPLIPVKVRFYFTKAEFDAFVGANDGDANDAYWLNDLKVAKFSSLACQSVIGASGETMLNIDGYGSLTPTAYYIDVIVPSFSGFYLKNVNGSVILPVNCLNFSYKLNRNDVQLFWNTDNEVNNSHFIVEKSFDGVSFSSIGNVPATTNSNYLYTDANATGKTVYYRLKQVDKDGKMQIICSVLNVAAATNTVFSTAYPNPVSDYVTIKVQNDFTGIANVQLVNALGQVLQKQVINIHNNNKLIVLNTQFIKAGTYTIIISTNNGTYTQKITKF